MISLALMLLFESSPQQNLFQKKVEYGLKVNAFDSVCI